MGSIGVKESGGKVTVWGQLKQAFRPRNQSKLEGQAYRMDVHASALATEAKPALEKNSMSASAPIDIEPSAEAAPRPAAAPSFGYLRGLERRFAVTKEIARGGNGIVTLAVERSTGKEYAVKSMLKVLDDPNVSEKKRAEHAAAIKREVAVLRRLRGCFNVASLEEVYEDDSRVHLVLEHCSGGELHHAVGQRHYTERTVASYLRAVLRTLAQCHAQKIIHRDVKPGNFLLASADPRAPLKSIDFGLAVFYDEKSLPLTDLGLEGTPWFMAPEVLSSQVTPASDVWSAGVMAAQLLTGRFPFDDHANPFNPSLTKVWKSILCDDLNLKRSHWDGVSEEAKAFVALLLNKDPTKRPSAKEALRHPWLAGPGPEERGVGRSLGLAVVQRIQRYGASSIFKRSVLQHIAGELLGEGRGEPEWSVPLGEDARPLIVDPKASPLEYLYERLSLAGKDLVDRQALAEGLAELGYRLGPDEIGRLLDQLDPGNTGVVAKSEFAASQMDWRTMQVDRREAWLACARRAFADLDVDGDGVLSVEEMLASLRRRLPAEEVEGAVRHALEEAARNRGDGSGSGRGARHGAGASQHGGSASDGDSLRGGLNFQQFVRMLRAGSSDSLDLYDDRLGTSFGSPGSFDRLSALLEKSVRGSDLYRGTAAQLEPVPEADRE